MSTSSFTVISAGVHPADEEIPEHVPFVLIGAGTASFAAHRAIKKEKPDAKAWHNYSNTKKKIVPTSNTNLIDFNAC